MKKSIIGLVIGLIVGLTLSAGASTMLGKAIDGIYPLFIDGTRCQVDAVSIEGVSYVPVRTAAEMFGYDVNFSSDVVMLNKQKTTPQTVSSITNDLDYVQAVSGVNKNSPDTSTKLDIKNTTEQQIQTPKVKSYNLKSNTLIVVSSDYGILRDGELYIRVSTFPTYYSEAGGEPVINIPGGNIVKIIKDQEYIKGIDCYWERIGPFIKLSSLGVKFVEKDGYLWIENN